eukprot:g8397.t1
MKSRVLGGLVLSATGLRSTRNSRSPGGWLSRLNSAATDDEGAQSISKSVPPMSSDAAAALLPLALLNAVTLLWGTQHAVIKLILQEDLSPGVTNFARFGIAALLFSPWTPGVQQDPPSIVEIVAGNASSLATVKEVGDGDRDDARGGGDGGGGGGVPCSAVDTWRAGAELGAWMFLGFAFQAVGLGFTTASRSAFLLYLNVKLVPFFAFLLEGRSISTPTWISAFLAFFGTVLLSSDGTPPNVGDLWSILAAATSAMFILRLETYSGSCEPSQLNSANLWITAGLCGVWAAWEVTAGGIDAGVAFEGVRAQAGLIGYLAVVTTALTNWMQAMGQRSVPAERAAVIYAMDPVYAAGFAYLLLGETLGPAGLVGAGIITGAALWSQGTQMPAADGGGGGDVGGQGGQGGEENATLVVGAAEEERRLQKKNMSMYSLHQIVARRARAKALRKSDDRDIPSPRSGVSSRNDGGSNSMQSLRAVLPKARTAALPTVKVRTTLRFITIMISPIAFCCPLKRTPPLHVDL